MYGSTSDAVSLNGTEKGVADESEFEPYWCSEAAAHRLDSSAVSNQEKSNISLNRTYRSSKKVRASPNPARTGLKCWS